MLPILWELWRVARQRLASDGMAPMRRAMGGGLFHPNAPSTQQAEMLVGGRCRRHYDPGRSGHICRDS
jgi:hypothetical protein